MEYFKSFSTRGDKELIEMALNSSRMRVDAKVELLKVLELRDEISSEFKFKVQKEVEKSKNEIKELIYLRNLGFKHKFDGEVLRVQRSLTAQIIDFFTIFLGVAMCVGLVSASGIILDLWTNGLTENLIAIILKLTGSLVLGAIGLLLLVRGLSRFLQFWDFKIIKENGNIKVQTNRDLSVKEKSIHHDDLMLIEEGGFLKMSFRKEDGSLEPLIETKESKILKTTLSELHKILTSSEI
ncbi:MAG: hypothetical protein ABJ004_11530 [Cyclobacteriaceae bacterium]